MRWIAVIDDGINPELVPDLIYDLEVTEEMEIRKREGYFKEQRSHGTDCARIIKKYLPEAKIGSIKILDQDTRRGTIQKFGVAIAWCAAHGAVCIHLSLGSKNSFDYLEIKKYIDQAKESGAVVVAALCNQATVSYPASLPGVIGVYSKEELQGEEYYLLEENLLGVQVCASSKHGLDKIEFASNSYAAPLITAKVFPLIEKKGNNICEIIEGLREGKTLKKYIERVGEETKIDIPVIGIQAGILGDTAKQTKEGLEQERYSVLLFRREGAELEGHEAQIPEGINRNKRMAQLAAYFYADILAVEIDGTDEGGEAVACDIMFYEQGFSLDVLKKYAGWERAIPYLPGEAAGKWIAKKAIEILS